MEYKHKTGIRVQLQNFLIRRKSIISALLSGLFLFLSFPKFGIGMFAWIALVPFFYALHGKKVYQGAITGFFIGMIFHVGLLYWIVHVTVIYGNLPFVAGLFLMFVLAAYLSLYFAVFAAGVVHFKNNSIPILLAAPICWVALEFLKSNLFTGFPWENLSFSQYLYIPIIQIADLTGAYGISFLIVLINVVIYDLLSFKAFNKKIYMEISLAVILLVSILTYGVLRNSQISKITNEAPSMNISLVQGNIDQNLKWDAQYQKETLEIYHNLSVVSSKSSNPGMIVWPETAVPFYFQDRDELHGKIVSLALQTGNWFLFGSPSYIEDRGDFSFLNTAYLLSPKGNVVAQYNKVHLVPYGEYVPLRRLFPFIGKLTAGIGDFKPGIGFIPIKADAHKIGVLICYEGILTEAGRNYKNSGADLLVNITNDAWFGNTSAPYQHLSMTVFRAVENRLYLARAANTGISAIIDPNGRILKQTDIFNRTILQGNVKYLKIPTWYSKCGNIFVYACFILLLLIFFQCEKRRI